MKRVETSPGPGVYDPSDHMVKPAVKTFKQSSSMRADLVAKEVKSKPGPGQYQSSYKTLGKDVPSYTMGKKQNNSMMIKTPGPGAYDPNAHVVKESTRNVTMKSSKRPDIAPKTARELPGPGTYASPLKSSTPSYTILSGRKEMRKD